MSLGALIQYCVVTLGLLRMFGAPTLLGQIRGRIVDSDRSPQADALVELWTPDRRVASTGSGVDGAFRVLAPPDQGGLVLLVRKIGYAPARLLLSSRDTFVVVFLHPTLVTLTALRVTQERRCPARDDPVARRLYQLAADRYDVSLTAGGVRTDALLYQARVSAESLGVVDTSRLTDFYLAGGARARSDPGAFYARPASGMEPARFDDWDHPYLESIQAWHFADTLFSRLNRFALAPAAGSDPAIVFCSSRGRSPYIVGTLQLASDSTLASAHWLFMVPGSDEEAGGAVYFAAPRRKGGGSPLLPVAGLYWRKRIVGYYMEWLEFRNWSQCQTPGDCGSGSRLR